MEVNKLQLLIQVFFQLLLWSGIIAAFLLQVAVGIAYFASVYFFLLGNLDSFFPSAVIEKTPEFFYLPYQEVWLPLPVKTGKVEHIHGAADSTVPSFMTQKLYAVAPEPKQLLLVTGADHNDTAVIVGL